MPERSESQVGIVLSEQNAVLGARGEHPVRFVDALRHQIVDQHADVGFVALQNDRRLPYPFAMRVDPCQQALRRSLRRRVSFRAYGATGWAGSSRIRSHSRAGRYGRPPTPGSGAALRTVPPTAATTRSR